MRGGDDLRAGWWDAIAKLPLEEALHEAWRASRRSFGRSIVFYAPSFVRYEHDEFVCRHASFPSISVTGAACALMCEHCRGLILRTMTAATTPEALLEACARFAAEGAEGVLISGGSDAAGSVPLKPFLDAIARVKGELGLKVAVHTGLVDEELAEGLASAGVDAAMLDVVGSDETLREVYHLRRGVGDVERSLLSLRRAGIRLIPHVVVGLHYGEIRGEWRALEAIAASEPDAVVYVVLTPTRGTPMEGVEPPSPEDVARVMAAGRLLMPRVPHILGCMRPKGEYRARLDRLALEAGVNGIAFPSYEAVDYAKELGLEYRFRSVCCSLCYEDFVTTPPITRWI